MTIPGLQEHLLGVQNNCKPQIGITSLDSSCQADPLGDEDHGRTGPDHPAAPTSLSLRLALPEPLNEPCSMKP